MPNIESQLGNTDLILIEKERAKRGLINFIKDGWNVLEPQAQPFVDGWAVNCMCEHLEAVTKGQIRRLLINVPPGFMKSMTTCVFWEAWEWGPMAMPWIKYLLFSYAADLTVRDNRKCRLLIDSEWYQQRWGSQFKFSSDQNQKQRYENDKRGFRLASSVGGLGTGERGNRIIFDDPHNVKQALSDVQRLEAITWHKETASTRTINKDSVFIGIMQRIHLNDLTGYILETEGEDWVQVCIPMEYDGRKFSSPIRPKAYKGPDKEQYEWDNRTQPDELAWPERFPREEVDRLKKTLGPYGAAAQLQLNPIPRSGSIFDITKIETVDAVPVGRKRTIRYWDLASTQKSIASPDPDWTVGLKLAIYDDGSMLVEDVVRMRDTPAKVEKAIKNTSTQDGKSVYIGIPNDPGQAGKHQVRYYVTQLVGFTVYSLIESGSKEDRAEPISSQVSVGNLRILRGAWNKVFLEELQVFPAGKKDQVDALSGAFSLLMDTAGKAVVVKSKGW
jgi:predicted phage terminase large subunit-like protein